MIVDTLRQLGELVGPASECTPFSTQFEDSPGVLWQSRAGLVLEAIETWAREQVGEAQVALENMEPTDPDERDERTILLLILYAREADFGSAVSLLTGAPTKGLALAHRVVAYMNSGPTPDTPDSLAAQGLNADAEVLAMAQAVLAA